MMLSVVGRLKLGVTIEQAQADLQVLTQRMNQQYPPQAAGFRKGGRADVVPLHAVLVHDVRSQLLILLGAVGLVLLIACANVASLLLSRAASRSRELAIRATLGAGRRRLIQQMLSESLLLAAIGSLLGLLAGLWGTQLLNQLIPANFPSTTALEWRTFSFVAALAILSVMLSGLFPALVASIGDVSESLKRGPVAKQRKAIRLRSLLVLGEISVSLVLLSGAGLLVRSFLRLTDVRLGFEASNLLLATVQRPLTLGDDSRQHAIFFEDALARIRALPGVSQAAATRQYPLGDLNNAAMAVYREDGTSYHPAGSAILLDTISPDYFGTIGMRLLKGRSFNDRDSADAPPVAILSESLAHQVFQEHDPIGQGVRTGPNMPEYTVVGVVSDIRNSTLDQDFLPEIYLPFVQQPSFVMTFVIRSKGDPSGLASGVRQAIISIDKNQPLSKLVTMDEVLATAVAPQRFRMQLLGLFALLALALAAVGVYGVTAYSVSQRTHEIGIRMALGAEKASIFRMVVGQGLRLALVGLAIGAAGALILARLLTSFSQLLYGVTVGDPFTFVAVSLLASGCRGSRLLHSRAARHARRSNGRAAVRVRLAKRSTKGSHHEFLATMVLSQENQGARSKRRAPLPHRAANRRKRHRRNAARRSAPPSDAAIGRHRRRKRILPRRAPRFLARIPLDRRPLRRPHAAQISRLHDCRNSHSRARNWREHSHLHDP